MEISTRLQDVSGEKWLQRAARIGLSAKGLVYCLIGLLTLFTATGFSNRKGDKGNALRFVMEQPFGKVLVIIIAISLLGYVMLRFLQTFAMTAQHGSKSKLIFKRIGYAVSGLIYLSFSYYAFKLVFSDDASNDSNKFLINKALQNEPGRWLVGIIALIVIGNGLYQVYRGASSSFMKHVKLHNSDFKKTFQGFGVVGYVSRGIVLCLIGYFLLRASIDYNADEAEGTGKAFDFLQAKGGNILMGVVAAGLLAYGIFMFVRARHEKLRFKLD